MPNRAHSKATRLAATFLARLASVDVAAAAFRISPNTVQAWKAGAVELPDDQWQAIEATLLARGAEMTARGETRGLVQTLTGAGIAARNTRYATLIARREQRRTADQEAEQGDPEEQAVHAALDALPDERQRFVADALRHELEQRATGPAGTDASESSADPSVSFSTWLQGVAAMTEDEFTQERAELDAEMAALEAASLAEYQQRRQPPPHPEPPVPDTATTPPQPPQPSLRVVDDYDHPSWTPWRRDDHW